MQKKAVVEYSLLFIVMCMSGYLLSQERYTTSGSGLSSEAELSSEETGKEEERVGDDRDEHGCIGSAGYCWCEAKQKCLRNWEEECEPPDSAAVGGKELTYVNEDYGFELTFEKGWEEYRVVRYPNDFEGASFHVLLPTEDRNWPGVLDTDGDGVRSGYGDMFTVVVGGVEDWSKKCAHECKGQETPPCRVCTRYVAKNDKYVYSIDQAQAMPADLLALRDASLRQVEGSFRLRER